MLSSIQKVTEFVIMEMSSSPALGLSEDQTHTQEHFYLQMPGLQS